VPSLRAQSPTTPGSTEAAAGDQTRPADTRTQYPIFLQNSYISVNVGFIDYAFSERQLDPGFAASSIAVPHVAARVAIFGHELNRVVSLQGTYMRPVRFVTYTDVNGDAAPHHVWTHFGGATVKARAPVTPRVALYGEAGLGITSRHGFSTNGVPVVRDAHYASMLLGGGLEYHVSAGWDLSAGAVYSPGRDAVAQPHTVLVSGGFRYTMRPLSPERVAANRQRDVIFPAHVVQIEYSTGYGYAINTFVSQTVPVFWGGDVRTDEGLSAHYQQNVFHTRKIFALDLGASVGSWRSRIDHDRFATLSVYPLLRFTLVRRRAADFYVCYSLAGPTFISRALIDRQEMGSHFTFQDFMGAGVFVGPRRRTSITVKINHYSNGNIFTENAGVKVPLTVGIGYAF
jgi:lipid A 3-O-deacylase PagL